MSGHDVQVLQDFLRRAGVAASVRLDGEFGAGTARAVRRFERASRPPGRRRRRRRRHLRAAHRSSARTPRPTRRHAPLQLRRPATGDKAASDGLAIAPEDAPDAVKQIIAAGNGIANKPYKYGGGHGELGGLRLRLLGLGLLRAARRRPARAPARLRRLLRLGRRRARASGSRSTRTSGHIYMVVAGLRFDTSGRSASGSRWQADMRSSGGYAGPPPGGHGPAGPRACVTPRSPWTGRRRRAVRRAASDSPPRPPSSARSSPRSRLAVVSTGRPAPRALALGRPALGLQAPLLGRRVGRVVCRGRCTARRLRQPLPQALSASSRLRAWLRASCATARTTGPQRALTRAFCASLSDCRGGHVEAHLDARGGDVRVLAAGPRRAARAQLDLPQGQVYAVGQVEARPTIAADPRRSSS